MTETANDILDDLFHGCALAAFLDQAQAEQDWPSSEATRQRAYRYYEEALAVKNCGGLKKADLLNKINKKVYGDSHEQ